MGTGNRPIAFVDLIAIVFECAVAADLVAALYASGELPLAIFPPMRQQVVDLFEWMCRDAGEHIG